ncbi:hypothetical protein [Mucilaginibacter sp. 3215]|uniref:hypothetical protein n=1 Tax=Mucilaginibacter sp. 3215 TaxID=3373912 RepID=UPI003D262D26
MKTKIGITFFLVFFLTFNKPLSAQQTTDAGFIFKTWLFLEHKNNKSRYATEYAVKDSALFDLFQNGLALKFDTLRMNGFGADYIFLAVSFTKKAEPYKRSVVYKAPKEIGYISIAVDNCQSYVICLNKSKGTSYRLSGFSGNDFLGFLHEFQGDYRASNGEGISVKEFLSRCTVATLDFACLYEGLTEKNKTGDIYPCLRSCSDATVTVH